jgi:hypothetical protein
VGEAGRVAEQHPQRDLAFWVLLEGAVDGELGQVGRDRRVEVEAAGGNGLHDRRRREQLRHRLDAEDRVGGDHTGTCSVDMAEALDPQRPVPVDEGDGKPRDALLCHQLRDTRSVCCDDACSRVGRDCPGLSVGRPE